MSGFPIDGKTFIASKQAEFVFLVAIEDGWHKRCTYVQTSTQQDGSGRNMARIDVRGKLADFEAALPGFAKLWKQIKDTTGTKVRMPKSITFTDIPQAMYLSDGYIGKRYALDLETMTISPSVHVSSGEWACHNGSNNDREIVQIPNGKAVIDCEFNDYYRVFSLTIVVASGTLPKQLAA